MSRSSEPAPPGAGQHARHGAAQLGRHRGSGSAPSFERGFAALGDLALAGVTVSARAADLATGAELFSVDDRVVMPTASIGKVLLLIEVAARIVDGSLGELDLLDRTAEDEVGDSGLWQHLQAPTLPVSDLAVLVGASSDNLATNVLLRHVGLDTVTRRTATLGLSGTALLDRVRDRRGPDDAPQLSVGSATELVWLFGALSRGEIVDADTSRRVVSWLALDMDLSLVAGAFGLDPLAHLETDHGIRLMNKTGTDDGVRSEAGVLRGPSGGVAYAVSMTFADTSLEARLSVLAGMRTIGLDILDHVHLPEST